jgi:uncharacterized membrane protein
VPRRIGLLGNRLLAVCCIAPPCLIIIIGIPLLFELVPPNSFYGFRTPNSFGSQDRWYFLNFVSGASLVLAGAFSLLTNILIWLISTRTPPVRAAFCCGAWLACLTIGSLVPFLF